MDSVYFFTYFLIFFGGLECIANAAHFSFLRDVWQKATIASRRANNLATHPPS
jgi:hypothetical protein